jgi:hypothetical protein
MKILGRHFERSATQSRNLTRWISPFHYRCEIGTGSVPSDSYRVEMTKIEYKTTLTLMYWALKHPASAKK